MLKTAYGQDVMSNATFHRLCNVIKDGQESVADEPREGHPSTARNEILVNTASVIVREDRRIIVRELATRLNIAIGSTFVILNDDLEMRRVCCRWIPRLLSVEQMAHRISVCSELLKGGYFEKKHVNLDD